MGSGGVTYLPFVSGILSANAKKEKILKENLLDICLNERMKEQWQKEGMNEWKKKGA